MQPGRALCGRASVLYAMLANAMAPCAGVRAPLQCPHDPTLPCDRASHTHTCTRARTHTHTPLAPLLGVPKPLAAHPGPSPHQVKRDAIAISLVKGMRVGRDGPQLISQMIRK